MIPVVGIQAVEIPAVVGTFDAPSLFLNPHLALLPCPATLGSVKSFLVCAVVCVVWSVFAGCATGKKKSSVRLYEGDSSPNIRMYDEKPGYPLNRL